MTNPILISINKKYKLPLFDIISVKQKKSGRVWVYYKDQNGQTKIAVAKHDARTQVNIINQYLTILAKPPLVLEIEK